MNARLEIGYRAAFTPRGRYDSLGVPSAAVAKNFGGTVCFRAHVGRTYNVHLDWEVREAKNPFTAGGNWILSEVMITGSKSPVETLFDLDTFATYREAITAAKRLARAALVKARSAR